MLARFKTRKRARRLSSADEDPRPSPPPRAPARLPCKRVQRELLKAREELVEARNQLIDTTVKLMQCEADLRRERDINQMAREYIPEGQLDEFLLALPNRQPVWGE